jgi:hypothetical protein
MLFNAPLTGAYRLQALLLQGYQNQVRVRRKGRQPSQRAFER